MSAPDSIHKDITRGASITFAGNFFKLAEFLLTLLAARLFGVGVWGQYIFLNTLFLPVLRFSSAGLDKGLIWYVARHQGAGCPPGFFTRVRNRMLFFSLVMLLGFGIYQLATAGHSRASGGLVDPLSLLYMALAIPLATLTNFNLGISLAMKKIEHEVLVRTVLGPLLYLGLPCACALLFPTVRTLAFFYLLGSAVACGVSAWLAAPLKKSLVDTPAQEPADKAMAALWHYSWPMGLRDVLLSLQQRVDVWCLALFLPPQSLGIYGLALSIANSIKTIRASFDNILLAVISQLRRGVDSLRIRQAYLHAGQATVSLQTPIFAFLVFFAGPLLSLSGAEYAAGEPALLVFAFALIIAGYLGLSGVVVLGLGKSRWAMFNDLLCLALALAFNFLLVPRYGIVGAAMGTSLSILLTQVAWYLETIYLIRMVPMRWNIAANFLIGVGLTALAHFLWRRHGDSGLPARALYFAGFAVAYGIALYGLQGKSWPFRRGGPGP